MPKALSLVVWLAVAALGAGALSVIALERGETISAAWIVVAGLCSYAVAYRFHARFIGHHIVGLDPRRATPAERLENGRDFVPTTKWVLYGHHFSAISGAGPLVGPTLAAQFGFLPGTIWLIAGVILGGAVQDFVILCASMRRDGKSLGQMAKEEVNPVAGMAAMVAIFAIMIILLAVLALVVTNALRDSPWGLFTIAATIPIALLMGLWMTKLRPGRVPEATVIGIALLMGALYGGTMGVTGPHVGGGLHLVRHRDRLGGDDLRLDRVRVARVAAPHAARLPFRVHEGRNDPDTGHRDHRADAAAQDAGDHAVRGRHRARVRGQVVSLRLHHDRVRRGVRLPRARGQRHDAEDADARVRRHARRLRRACSPNPSSA